MRRALKVKGSYISEAIPQDFSHPMGDSLRGIPVRYPGDRAGLC